MLEDVADGYRKIFLGGSSDGYHNPTFHNHVWDNTIFVVIAVIDQIKVACWCWRCCLLSRLSRPSALLDLDADALFALAASRCALCALLLVVALISSSLVLDSIPPMQQFFRVIRGQSSALDDVSDSSAVPVFGSVSSEMSVFRANAATSKKKRR